MMRGDCSSKLFVIRKLLVVALLLASASSKLSLEDDEDFAARMRAMKQRKEAWHPHLRYFEDEDGNRRLKDVYAIEAERLTEGISFLQMGDASFIEEDEDGEGEGDQLKTTKATNVKPPKLSCKCHFVRLDDEQPALVQKKAKTQAGVTSNSRKGSLRKRRQQDDEEEEETEEEPPSKSIDV
eukprot:TRINITY_DN6573_c0_g2_i2.p2 TRINITY_DN6573_c0_g2~~TRINITY_DN6573_c0_g2_i2.p2  ORF type:complete len:182 (+),score=57.91 TRINITY_DN6573_c0_g2_i2:58-603(+)